MFFEDLTAVVDYIENNLKQDIEIKKLAMMMRTNQDTFKRIFALICGVSVAEYIKKRRLTVCCSDLKKYSVLDVALMYGYSSSAGFSRAFYDFHNCYPSDVKQNDNTRLNAFLPIKVSTNCGLEAINYRVEKWGKREFFGYSVVSNVNSLPQVVRAEYTRFLEKYKAENYYGITFYQKDNVEFWFCLNEPCEDFVKLEIPKGQWLVLEYSGDYAGISNFVRSVYKDLGKQINCRPARKIDMEIYSPKSVKLCFLLD